MYAGPAKTITGSVLNKSGSGNEELSFVKEFCYLHWEKNVVLIDYPGWVQRLLSQIAYVISHFLCSELTEYRKYSSSHASV